MHSNKINTKIGEVAEQIEQSFQMLNNALSKRQNEMLTGLNQLAQSDNSAENNEDGFLSTKPDVEKICDYLKFSPIKMDDVLKEIREFGTISMTTADPKMSTICDRNTLKQCPVNEEFELNIVLKKSNGDIVEDKGILEPKIHLESKGVIRPMFKVVDSPMSNLIKLGVKLPRAGEYELSVQFCESTILGSPFTLNGHKAVDLRRSRNNAEVETIPLEYLYKVGSKGLKPSNFGNPQSIVIHGEVLLVTDSGNSCVQIFKENGEYVTCFGPKEKKIGKLVRPIDIAETPNGHFLITDFDLGVVVVYDLNGNYVSSFGQKILLGPKGICVDKSGRILVADNKDSSLVIFKSTGKFLRKIKARFKDEDKLAGPHFLTVTTIGDILITDFYNHCVKVFDTEGTYLSKFGNNGQGWGDFSYPTGICCSIKDDIIVSDWGNNRIVIFNSSYMCTQVIKPTMEPLSGPQGVALNKSNTHILIVDSGNHCFKMVRSFGCTCYLFEMNAQKWGKAYSPNCIYIENNKKYNSNKLKRHESSTMISPSWTFLIDSAAAIFIIGTGICWTSFY